MTTQSVTTLLSDDYDASTIRITCANRMLSTMVGFLSTHDLNAPFDLNPHRLADALHGAVLLLDEAELKLGKITNMEEVEA